MGGLDWWLDNLSTKETILRRHYAPEGFLYMCHTSTRSLMTELRSSLQPLASLPLDYSIPWKQQANMAPSTAAPAAASGPTSAATTPVQSPKKASPVHKAPNKLKARPVSFIQTSPKANNPVYRRTQSQHSGLSPRKTCPAPANTANTSAAGGGEQDRQQFSSLKKKWESLCGQKKVDSSRAKVQQQQQQNQEPQQQHQATDSGVKSRIPRPVQRLFK